MKFLAQASGIALPDSVRPDTLPAVEAAPVKIVITTLVGDVILTLIQFAGAIAIIMIIIAGFRYVTSQGEEEDLGAAKANLVWTIVALVILIFSYAIVRTVFDLVLSFGARS